MSFIDSYKSLEKLCGELLNDDRRLSAYIDEMKSIPGGSYYVRGWDDDLKQLKHYRWIRNQIVHEPDCNEKNMCKPEDALWLDTFCSRIMHQTDPLALYAKAAKPHAAMKSAQVYKPTPVAYHSPRQAANKKQSQTHIGCLTFFVCILLLIGAIYIILKII